MGNDSNPLFGSVLPLLVLVTFIWQCTLGVVTLKLRRRGYRSFNILTFLGSWAVLTAVFSSSGLQLYGGFWAALTAGLAVAASLLILYATVSFGESKPGEIVGASGWKTAGKVALGAGLGAFLIPVFHISLLVIFGIDGP